MYVSKCIEQCKCLLNLQTIKKISSHIISFFSLKLSFENASVHKSFSTLKKASVLLITVTMYLSQLM